jgi:hypothetical protein
MRELLVARPPQAFDDRGLHQPSQFGRIAPAGPASAGVDYKIPRADTGPKPGHKVFAPKLGPSR